MKVEKKDITLKRVRISFPSLFKTEIFKGKDTEKYGASFLLSKKDTQTIQMIEKEIERLKTESKLKFSPDKIAFQDGDHKDYDGYADHYVIKASSRKRPNVVNRDRSPIVESDDIIYGGCYVNASISFWVMDNDYGKKINAQLNAVQFVKDGERFGDSFNVENAFDDISSEEDEDCPF
jgi:hypothetical protein